MKKLFLLLLTVCASVMTWAQTLDNNTAGLEYTLNPYAYDLKIKSWDPATRILTVQFKLNSPPNLNGDSYNSVTDGEPNGVQIYAVDQQGNEYRIGGPGRADIQNCIKNGYMDFTMDLSAGTTVDGYGPVKQIPVDEILTWKVRVKGRSSRTAPLRIDSRPANFKRPRNTCGVAVGTDPYAESFGKILVAESKDGSANSSSTGTWYWLYNALYDASWTWKDANNNTVDHRRMPALLEYTPQLNFTRVHRRHTLDRNIRSWFETDDYGEPHRVRISDDGRIFVSSYHPTAGAAIMEYLGDNTFITIVGYDLTENKDTYAKYNRRVVDFDVKGSGENLKIVAAWVKPRATYKNSKYYAQIQCYEYEIGLDRTNLHQTNDGTLVAECGDYDNGGSGWIYQGYLGTADNKAAYDAGILGHIGVAYGKGENNPIWMKIDFALMKSAPAHILYFDNTGSTPKKAKKDVKMSTSESTQGYYGGNALLVTEDYIITANGDGKGEILFYPIQKVGSSDNLPTETYRISMNYSSCAWSNGLALDYANNLYVVSDFYGNLLTIPLPYSGTVETPAPKNSTFSLSHPVPNILATDLQCAPHEKYARYIFSFNVNTKPEGAELRFYTTEAAMLADCNQNETYGRFDDHSKCQYYYRFENGELKQGRMSVELGILGHEGDKELSDKKLPAGELYWNVFLKTRKSSAFAPIYVQPNTGEHLHYRIAATIDNNPDNDGFGHIYAVDYKRTYNSRDAYNMDLNPCKLMRYTIGDAGVSDDGQGVNSSERYALIDTLSANEMVQPRRPAVAPDGMVYFADFGNYVGVTINGPTDFVKGGIWLFNPNDPLKDGSTTEAKLGRFYSDNETTSGLSFIRQDGSLKLYKTNTYEEITLLPCLTNGYRRYSLDITNGIITHYKELGGSEMNVSFTGDAQYGGDANGDISVKATDDGVWFCQNRKGSVPNSATANPDNSSSIALMFYNKSGNRTFRSYDYAGGSLTQYTTSILQSTPGAGMTVSPDGKLLYVVNHEGNILEFKIGGNADNGITLSLQNTYNNPTNYKCISTMNFDYAGNLVVTVDENYPAGVVNKKDANGNIIKDSNGNSIVLRYEESKIVVFTMPYNRDNARSIPASKSERFIPERLSQDMDNTVTLDKEGTYALDLYRPLQGATYNTICLPFDVDLSTLTAPHKLYGADAMEFTGVTTPIQGGEKVLCLNFTPVTQLQAGKPYIIYVENHVRGLIEFSQVTRKKTVVPQSVVWNVQSSSITYTGVYNPTPIEEGKTILVDQNRLANVTTAGTLSGFRGYFTIPESLRSLKAMISTRHDTPTGLEDMNITERTYQKFLREGRVYIRVGETLYTIDGQVVE